MQSMNNSRAMRNVRSIHDPVTRAARCRAVAALAAALSVVAAYGVPALAQPFPRDMQGIEALARGPVHEAFAEPVMYEPQASPLIPRTPPDPIEELPPDQRPEGDNVVWIRGYWAYDDEQQNYLWVSGIWRELPPARQFVPGYWRQVVGGSQWVSGFWYASAHREIEYLPPPPETLEMGPATPAPAPDQIWVPGVWIWRETRYAWRPGYWIAPQANWVWVPARYVWAPAGYVFVGGYWDRPLPQRGLLFAPVQVQPAVIARPAFVYRPSVVIDVNILVGRFFTRPQVGHYYFGDYYARDYFRRGYYPAFSFHQSRYGYDPIFATHRARYRRTNDDWEGRLRNEYRFYRDNPAARPPRTYVAQQNITNITVNNTTINNTTVNNTNIDLRSRSFTRPLDKVEGSRDFPLRLQRVDDQRREQVRKSIGDYNGFERQRRRMEAAAPNDRPIRSETPAPGTPPRRETSTPPQPGAARQPGSPNPQGPVGAPGQPGQPGQPGKPPVAPQPVTPGQPGVTPQPGTPGQPNGVPRRTTPAPGAGDTNKPAVTTPGSTVPRSQAQPGNTTAPRTLDRPYRVTLPRSPVMGTDPKKLEKGKAPPARPKVPQFTADVQKRIQEARQKRAEPKED